MNEQEIFTRALEHDPSERPAYLNGACGDNPVLRKRVEELLAAHEGAADFMKPRDDAVTPTLAPVVREKPGTEIGAYTIREQIGEGGFGLVYVAEQTTPVRRRVALKIIKPGMDSKEVIARFEAERQALALMNHPNVARVLDAGATNNGRPFFVMELVHGLPITEFCDKNKLPTRDRLELFLDVCRAVHHAHQKGIIHRDLKPSNIMVTLHDGKPVPKVIDFGVAKALSQQLTEKTIYTNYGQVVGTPQYMSPEQAEMSGLGIDTRSDIYSLGVLLYELLTGTSPVDKQRLMASGYAEMMRIIREEEPPRPSKRVSTLGQEATAIAQYRGTDERKLSHSLRGELDWIVMKALEKDRERRYETASSFAEDIRRFLENEAVHARPTSVPYRARKYITRHPAQITILASAFAAALFAVGMIVSVGYQSQLSQTNNQLETRNQELADSKSQLETSLVTEERAKNDLERVLYFRHVAQALTAWHDDEIERAQRLLARCPARWRHWEWHYVENLVNSGVTTIYQASSWVLRLKVSPNGRLLASKQGDHVVILDLVSGAELFKAPDVGWAIAFSPDSKRILVGGSKATIWDLDTRKAIALPHHGRINSAAFSPDGNRVAISSRDGGVAVYDLAGLQLVESLAHGKFTGQVAFSPDNELIASVGRTVSPDGATDLTRTVKVWNAKSYALIWEFRAPGSGALAFSPDSTKLVSGDFELLKIWDLATGDLLRTLRGHTGQINDASFSADGRFLVSASHDHSAVIWDAVTGELLQVLKGHSDVVTSVAFSGDNETILTSSRDRTIKRWQPKSRREARTPKGHLNNGTHARFGSNRVADGPAINSVAVSPDGRRIASGSSDHTVKLWNTETGSELAILKGHAGAVVSIAFGPGGERLVSASNDMTAIVWDVNSGEAVHQLIGHASEVHGVAFSSTGAQIATACNDGTIKMWNADTAEEEWTTGFQFRRNWAYSVAFSPDDSKLVSGHYVNSMFPDHPDLMLKLWDVQTGEELLEFTDGHTHIASKVVFSPNGREILSGSWDNSVRIWDSETSKETAKLEVGGWVHCVAYSPDGERIAAATQHGTIRIWDRHTGLEALTLHGHQGAVRSVDFSPDGSLLVSGGDDGTIKIWDAGTTEFIRHSD